MLQWLRYVARTAIGVARRFYGNVPLNPYEAILFSYLRVTIAQIFFRKEPAWNTDPPLSDPSRAAHRKG